MKFRYEHIKVFKKIILYDNSSQTRITYSLSTFNWGIGVYFYPEETVGLPMLEADSLEEAKKKIEYIFLEYSL